MKIIYLSLLAVAIVSSCNTIPQTKQPEVDNRPKSQIELLDQLDKADSILSNQNNDIGKKEAVDSGKVAISNLIVNKFDCEIVQWPMLIKEIKVSEWPFKMIDVTFYIPKTKYFDKSSPSAITLSTSVDYSNQKLRDVLKNLNPFDSVKVTGSFKKDANNKIDFSAEDLGGSLTFFSPNFDVFVTDIQKQKSKN